MVDGQIKQTLWMNIEYDMVEKKSSSHVGWKL